MKFMYIPLYLSLSFFAAAMAKLRPQNFPLSAIYRNLPQIVLFVKKNLCFHHFIKTSGSEGQHHPFLSLPHNSFKAPSLF